jgi:hypothetical protein
MSTRVIPSWLVVIACTGCQLPRHEPHLAPDPSPLRSSKLSASEEPTAVDPWPELSGIPLRLVDMPPEPLPDAVLLSATRQGFTGNTGVRWGRHWLIGNEVVGTSDAVGLYDAQGHRLWAPSDPALPAQWKVADSQTDLTGDGIADLHLHEWNGSPICCVIHHVIDGAIPHRSLLVGQGRGEASRFRRLEDGRAVLYLIQDLASTGPNGSEVVFWQARSYRDGEFRPDIDATRRAHREMIDPDELRAALKAHARERAHDPNADSDALDLLLTAIGMAIHGGRTHEARTLIDAVWPAGLPGQREFRCKAASHFAGMDDEAYLSQMHGQTMEQLLGAESNCGVLDPARED